jgi:TPR repeat protein/Flp pilus assembly protein TadD
MTRPIWSPLEAVQGLFLPKAAMRRAGALVAAGKRTAAFRLYARAARKRLAEAQYRVGRCYLEGTGVPLSRKEATRWLELAGRQDHVEAQSLLAMLHVHGLAGERRSQTGGDESANRLFCKDGATDPDYPAAEYWARRAAEGGSPKAQALLAFLLTSGPAQTRNLDEAETWYAVSAAAGCPQGLLGLAAARARQGGDGAAREVALHLAKAAEAELPTALYLLGLASERGEGVARDPAAAAQYYRRSAEKGSRAGQLRWGLALMRGTGVKSNPCQGETWLRRAALAGDPEAAALVGDLYAACEDVPPNYVEAAVWFRRAADAGHKGAARALGLMRLAGADRAPDLEEAAEWLRISAIAGHPIAQVEFGNLVLKGVGSEADRIRICTWFEQSASQGNPLAAFNYAICLARGIGVARDDKKAALWLSKAAAHLAIAKYWYGCILVAGRSVAPNPIEGRALIAQAAESGLARAELTLGEMLRDGIGGPTDQIGALALFERAGSKGQVAAMVAAAAMCSGSDPVSANAAVARRWLRLAADRGHAQAAKILNRNSAGLDDECAAEHLCCHVTETPGNCATVEEITVFIQTATEAGTLTQGMVPRVDRCACGSGLQSFRCCSLDPHYAATPEARQRMEQRVGRASDLFANGDVAAADTICCDVLNVVPRSLKALWLLYQIRRRSGQRPPALALLQRLVALEPNNVETTLELTTLLFEQGDMGTAEWHARNAVRLAPADARGHNWMGMILTEQQRPQIGEFHYRRVLELLGRDPIVLANLAWNLKGQGRINEARELYRESVAGAPGVFQTWFGWAQLEEADRDFAAAESRLDRAAEIRPNDDGLHLARAALLARQGKWAAALAEFVPGSNSDGGNGTAIVCRDPNALLEKGRILDRLGRHDEAFGCFAQAKRLARETSGKSYGEQEACAIAERLRQFFVGDRLRLMPPATLRPDIAQPIFILGFPRSGTTLAEQALSAHPRISAGDELPFINEFGDSIPRLFNSPLSYPDALAELWMGDNRHGLDALRDTYLQKAEARKFIKPGSAWFTDKMPLNEMHLGLISLVFPHSPLIHILRHPLDVVLSVFSYQLTHGYFCAYALETIARHYVLVSDLAQHYRTQMALKYLPVRYEDMVEDMDASVRRMLEFVDEPFSERCVNFHENKRLPHTPSYAQVTEKLYDRSRFRYRHYLKHLEPVLPILQPVIDRLGYSLD